MKHSRWRDESSALELGALSRSRVIGVIVISVIVGGIVGCNAPSKNADPNVAATSSAVLGYVLPGVGGVITDEEIEEARRQQEVVVDGLRGQTVKSAMQKLGWPSKFPDWLDPSPRLFAVPALYADLSADNWDNLVITATATKGRGLYFGVIESSQISKVAGLAKMLATPAPIYYNNEVFPVWSDMKDLLRKLGGIGPSDDLIISVGVPR